MGRMAGTGPEKTDSTGATGRYKLNRATPQWHPFRATVRWHSSKR